MGWLRCEPDSMFRDHVFSAAGLASHLAPATVARLAAVGRQLPPALAAAIWKSSFVAAPMQLHALVSCVTPPVDPVATRIAGYGWPPSR